MGGCALVTLMQPFWAWKVAVTSSGHHQAHSGCWQYSSKKCLLCHTHKNHHIYQSPLGGDAVMQVQRNEGKPISAAGFPTARTPPRERCTGSITRFTKPPVHGPSRTRTPRSELPLLNSLAHSFWLYSLQSARKGKHLGSGSLWVATTRETCTPCWTWPRRRHTPQQFWWS